MKGFYDRHFPGECNPNGWKLCLGDNGVPKCIEKHKWCDKERSCGIFMKWCDKKFSLSKVIDGMCLPMNYQYQYYQSGDYEFECPKYGLNEEYMTTASGMDFLIHGQIRYFLLWTCLTALGPSLGSLCNGDPYLLGVWDSNLGKEGMS